MLSSVPSRMDTNFIDITRKQGPQSFLLAPEQWGPLRLNLPSFMGLVLLQRHIQRKLLLDE